MTVSKSSSSSWPVISARNKDARLSFHPKDLRHSFPAWRAAHGSRGGGLMGLKNRSTTLMIALAVLAGNGVSVAVQGRGSGQRGAQGGAGAQRGGGFPQFTRPLASQDVLFRGKELYEENCASC